MQITSKDDVKKLGSIMGIWAHPDDETWCAAGLLSMAADNGQSTCCITITKGEHGVQDEARWPASRLAEIREKELEAALNVIGVAHQHQLGYEDGCCNDVIKEEVVAKLATLIAKEKPDTIITFGYTGSTGHPDHIAACHWTSEAAKRAKLDKTPVIYHSVHSRDWYDRGGKAFADQFNVFFNIPSPPLIEDSEADIVLKLDDNYCKRKLDAMRAHASQTTKMFEAATEKDLTDFACVEVFVLEDRDQIYP